MLHVGIAICDPAGMLYQMIMLASSQKKKWLCCLVGCCFLLIILPCLVLFFLGKDPVANEPLELLPKRTYQPSTIKRKRTHGFLTRYVSPLWITPEQVEVYPDRSDEIIFCVPCFCLDGTRTVVAVLIWFFFWTVSWYGCYYVASAVNPPRAGGRWSPGESPRAGTEFQCSEIRGRSGSFVLFFTRRTCEHT
jgi:hypothetical protein